MGQRHQLFVIAKINGRYRNLLAVHHQWLYGHTALRRCLDTLKTFGSPANRMPIQQELIAASKHDEEFWVPENDVYSGYSPFPFIATCLIIGTSFNVDGYFHSLSILPFGTAFDEGDNNDGITIFDITDLSELRYCFVDFHGMESKRPVDLMTPLSARTYLEAYYDLDETEAEIGLRPLLEHFEARTLVTTAALEETWPDGDWQDDEAFVSEGNTVTDNSDAARSKSSPAEPAGETPDNASMTLRDRSMDSLLDSLLNQSSENPELMAEAKVLSDFVPKLRLKLYDQAADVKPSASLLSLLQTALEDETVVDLSPFKNLTVEYLSVLVAGLRNGAMRVLNLSNMPDLTDTDLELILSSGSTLSKDLGSTSPLSEAATIITGNLRAIVLLETPKITIDFLARNLGHCELYHSELLWRPLRVPRRSEILVPWLKFNALHAVTQLVWVGLSSMQACDSKLRLEDGRINWSGVRYSTEASSRFSGDTSIKYKNFLIDVPLPAGKMIHSLRRLLQYITSPKLGWFEDWPKAAARCFATTSIQDAGDGYGVGPLSTTLYKDDSRDEYVESGKGRMLEPGEWAIVLVHEAFDARDQEALDKRELDMINRFGPRGVEGLKEWPEEEKMPSFKPQKRLRYALVKALPESGSTEKQFLVTDVLGYVSDVMGGDGAKDLEAKSLSGWWEKESSEFSGRFGYYGDDDVHGLLQKIYSDEDSDQGAPSQPRGIDPFEDIMRLMTLANRDQA